MKKLVFLLAVLFFYSCSDESLDKTNESNARPWNSETLNQKAAAAPVGCAYDYNLSIATSTISTYGATISWDVSNMIYCDLSSAKIQVRPIDNCTNQTGLGTIQNYPISNFNISSSMEITSAMIGKKCMMWRLVLDGVCNPNLVCNTSTPWQYFQLVP